MNTSAGDGDQPGLWPLAAGRPGDTAGNNAGPEPGVTPGRRRRALAARKQGAGPHPNTNTAGNEVANLWCIDELSRYLTVSKDTIYGWRKTGYGPPAIKVGKHLRWQPEGVSAWAKEQELSDE